MPAPAVTGTLRGRGWRDAHALLAYAGVPVTFSPNIFNLSVRLEKEKA